MKASVVALYGVGFCVAVAGGMWLGMDEPVDSAATATGAPLVVPAPAEPAASGTQASGLWAWGNAEAGKVNEPVKVLLAKALQPSSSRVEGDDPRDKLHKLAKNDHVVMKQLMESYGKETNSQTRDLIISLLSNVEKPEVLAFSRRLASSSDMAQRKDGFSMLQNLSGDSPEVRSIVLQALSDDKKPDEIMLALAALKPPAGGDSNSSQSNVQAADAAAIVAQLQKLARSADPDIRLQSILQLAQWDREGSSQEQWAQALADPFPQVRQAAVTAIAQSGIQSDTVKAALLGLANNPNESRDVRGNALQVLDGFKLSPDESANLSQLRSQVLGL